MHSFNNEQVYFEDKDSLPKNVKKYWNQRYNLFSKYDEGIYMNHELWFSVTPENLAIFIAKFVHSCDPSLKTICDVFCGGGGNVIQFARKFDKAIGVDFNETNLYCAQNNCEVYGVGDKVEFKLQNWIDIIEKDQSYFNYLQDEVDMLFASPPWGGPNYKNQEIFDLNYLEPLSIKPLLESFLKITNKVALFLPRNSDVGQLAQVTRDLLGDEAKCRVIYAYTDGYIKGILAFWGDIFLPENTESTEITLFDENFYDERPPTSDYHQNYSNQISNENFYDNPGYYHDSSNREYYQETEKHLQGEYEEEAIINRAHYNDEGYIQYEDFNEDQMETANQFFNGFNENLESSVGDGYNVMGNLNNYLNDHERDREGNTFQLKQHQNSHKLHGEAEISSHDNSEEEIFYDASNSMSEQ